MARLDSYKGELGMADGFRAGGDFPLMEAHDVQTKLDGTRLDENLSRIENKLTELDDAKVTVDKALSGTSTNPVQNDVIHRELNQKISRPLTASDLDRIYGVDRDVTYPTFYYVPAELSTDTGFTGHDYESSMTLVPRYVDKQLVTDDPTGDYSAVNLKTLNSRLSGLSGGGCTLVQVDPNEALSFTDNTGYLKLEFSIKGLYPAVHRLIIQQMPEGVADSSVPPTDMYTFSVCSINNTCEVLSASGSPISMMFNTTSSVVIYVAKKSNLLTNISIMSIHDIFKDYEGSSSELLLLSSEIIDSVPNEIKFSQTRYVYMIDNKDGTEKKIAIGMGSGTKGVTMPKNGLMLPQYNDAGRLCAADPGSDYHVVNFKTLNARLNEEVTKITARLDALTPSDPEVEIPTEFAWLDILSNAENAQILFNNANKYKFRGTVRDAYEFEGDGNLEIQHISDQVTFNFDFTPDGIPNFDDNQNVTGTISNFSIEVNSEYELNEYNQDGTYWGFDCTAELENDTAAMSVYKGIDEGNGPYIEIYIAIYVSLRSRWEKEGEERTGSGKLLMFNRRYSNLGYGDGYLWEIQAYVGKTSETAPFFPETMSLRQQSLNRQLIAFLEERRANNRNNNN